MTQELSFIRSLSLLPFKVLLLFYEFRYRPDRTLRGSNLPVGKNGSQWKKARKLPSWRYEFSAGELNGQVYVIGGVFLPSVWFPTRLVEIYDPKKDTWKTGKPYPKFVHHMGSAVLNGRLYVVGGNGIRIIPRKDVYAFDAANDIWDRCADLPTARGALGVASVAGGIYAAGGGINENPVNILESYDPTTDSWSKRRPMPTAREHVAAAAAEGRMFVLGGYAGKRFNNLTANEAYDPETDAWEVHAPLPYPVSGLAAAAVGGSIFVFGGEQGWAVSSEVHEYVIARDKWIRRKDLPVARYALTATTVGNRIHVIGGNEYPMGYDFRSDHDVFVPSSTKTR